MRAFWAHPCREAGRRPFQLWPIATLAGTEETTQMFAVIKAQGKQYKVAEGDVLTIDRLVGEKGKKITLGEVLMVGEGADLKLGKALSGAKVEAEIVDHGRDKKIIVFKKRRRQNYQRTRGHRQHQTTVKITSISA
jgi:large subunit ribosomal protein L21